MTIQKIVTGILVLGVLPVSSMIVARAQIGGTPVSTPRAANAPPLVPVRLNADGNFRIAPPYVADPAFTAKADGCSIVTRFFTWRRSPIRRSSFKPVEMRFTLKRVPPEQQILEYSCLEGERSLQHYTEEDGGRKQRRR